MIATDGDLEEALLRFFAYDEDAARGYQSLTTIFEKIHRPSGWKNSFFDQLRGPGEKETLRKILEGMVDQGLLLRRKSDQDYEPYFTASDNGIYLANFGEEGLVAEGRGEPQSVDASDWTGGRLVVVDARTLSEIRRASKKLQAHVRTVNFVSDKDRQDLIALSDALAALCEMVEPELTLLDQITTHPKFKVYASIFVFVATIRGALGI